MTKSHIHAVQMFQYAEDAATNENPWELWEYRVLSNRDWLDCPTNPGWHKDKEYRRKPIVVKTIRIGSFDVPEPLREWPKLGAAYYVPSITNEYCTVKFNWDDSPSDNTWLDRGLVHATKEAAELHAKALLSFTESPEF